MRLSAPWRGLTRREVSVIEHVAAGCSDKEIARLMGIGFTTVRTHLKNAMHKLVQAIVPNWRYGAGPTEHILNYEDFE